MPADSTLRLEKLNNLSKEVLTSHRTTSLFTLYLCMIYKVALKRRGMNRVFIINNDNR